MLGLSLSKEAQELVLSSIQNYWFNEIRSQERALTAFFLGIKVLTDTYGLDNLQYRFKLVLTNLKRQLLACDNIANSERSKKSLEKIPSFGSVQELQLWLGVIIAEQYGEEEIQALPEVWRKLIEKANPKIIVAEPFVFDE